MKELPILVSGLVQDESGEPISMARVAFVAGPEPFPDIAALTDRRGTFTLSAATPGRYELMCSADGFYPSKREVELKIGAVANVTFTLKHVP